MKKRRGGGGTKLVQRHTWNDGPGVTPYFRFLMVLNGSGENSQNRLVFFFLFASPSLRRLWNNETKIYINSNTHKINVDPDAPRCAFHLSKCSGCWVFFSRLRFRPFFFLTRFVAIFHLCSTVWLLPFGRVDLYFHLPLTVEIVPSKKKENNQPKTYVLLTVGSDKVYIQYELMEHWCW